MSKERLIQLLKENEVIKFGEFILSSGKESDYYIDIKKAITNPEILKTIAILISEKIDNLDNTDKIDKVAGPVLGAVPIATAVSLKANLPLLMIRKEKKGYGTSKLIEGDLNSGEKILVVEDVTTTGGSLLKAVEAIKDNEGIVKKAIVVVDREEGASETFKEKGIDFEPLISVSDFK